MKGFDRIQGFHRIDGLDRIQIMKMMNGLLIHEHDSS
jgi:hypothetical protein